MFNCHFACLWDLTNMQPYDLDALASLTDGIARQDAVELTVTLNTTLQPNRSLAKLSDNIEMVHPRGWPVLAQQPYMTKADAEEAAEFLEEPAKAP